jgi:hypothetical protein
MDLGMGASAPRIDCWAFMDYSRFYYDSDIRWVTRKPISIPKYDQVVIVFSYPVWIATLVTMSVFSATIAMFYGIYQGRRFVERGLTGPLRTPFDFIFLPFTSLVQFEPIPFFPKFSGGNQPLLNQHMSFLPSQFTQESSFYWSGPSSACSLSSFTPPT